MKAELIESFSLMSSICDMSFILFGCFPYFPEVFPGMIFQISEVSALLFLNVIMTWRHVMMVNLAFDLLSYIHKISTISIEFLDIDRFYAY